jgi:hypothetical protein
MDPLHPGNKKSRLTNPLVLAPASAPNNETTLEIVICGRCLGDTVVGDTVVGDMPVIDASGCRRFRNPPNSQARTPSAAKTYDPVAS